MNARLLREVGAVAAAWLSALPERWREAAAREYLRLRGEQVNGYRFAGGRYTAPDCRALDWLSGAVRPVLDLGGVSIAADDGALVALAEGCARKCAEYMAQDVGESWRAVKGLPRAAALCGFYGVRWPAEFEAAGQWARLTDAAWWVRGLRRSHNRAREAASIRAGRVHRRANVYCSDDTVARRGEQVRRNRLAMEAVEMVSESGEVATLAELAAAGMANAANRRAELMTRIAGMEAAAKAAHRVAEFVTLTTPSRMHSTLSNGRINPKYDKTTPAEAQAYLAGCWSRARAQLARDGVRVFGLRVAEPHHDGTPHWHMVLFVRRGEVGGLREVLRKYFLAMDGEEAGAQKNRCKFVAIDPRKGSAAGYVAKYVSKNIGGIIDGEGRALTSDECGKSSVEVWRRVEAWAACWSIRQFQQIGGHLVSVWRELRRVPEAAALGAGGAILAAWRAAQRRGEKKADWSEYMAAMGGIDCQPLSGAVALGVDYEEVRGRYGRAIVRRVVGVVERFGAAVAAGEHERWQVLRKGAAASLGLV